MKVLILGDSSSLPRENIYFDSTYYGNLKKDIDIENSAITNNNSYRIYNDLEPFMLYGYNPDIVILNYGIVDVYPRPYPNMLYRLLSCSGLLPVVDKFLKKSKLYYLLGDLFGFKEVSLENFKIYTEGIVHKLLEKKVENVIIIGIIKPYKVLLNSKTIQKEVELYNQVFKDLALVYSEVNYIDIYNDSDEDFTIWDGYHYSEEASNYLTEKLSKIIND